MAKKPSKPVKNAAPKTAKPAAKPAAKAVVKAPAKPAAKPAAKVPAKVATKAPAPAAKPTGKPAAKPALAAAKAPVKNGVKVTKPAPAAAKGGAKPAAPAQDGKGGRKGITIVQPKPVKKAKPKPRAPMSGAHAVPAMHGGRSSSKPLIPSGPAASPSQPLGYHGGAAEGPRHDFKSPFGKRELAHFRQILLQKRAELVRDVSSMESEALKGESGSLSSLPQHLAEQGSETYDQSLSLDLAAADRKLIREIDDALARIDNGTYGVCEITGKPIKIERLEELPWARHSIEAARDLERRQMRL